MPYFTVKHPPTDRTCKVLADIFCALLLGTFSVAFFGLVGGLVAFVLLEGCLLTIDWVMPSEDDAAGIVRQEVRVIE